MKQPKVSVVVPTYHRPELLERCLSALVEQDFDPKAYEVIVVDDGAWHAGHREATKRVVERSASGNSIGAGPKGPLVRYIPSPERLGPAAARNIGWRAGLGKTIAFTDDDCIPDRGWLRAGMAALSNGAVAATGRVRVPTAEWPTDYEANQALMESCEFLTSNCFLKREALEAVGGFDERFSMAWREDSDLHATLLRLCGVDKLLEAPEAVVVHPVRPARWGVSLQQQRKSMYNALLCKKHPAFYRERIQPRPPWRYYRMVAVLLSSVIALLARRRLLAAIGLLIWTILTGRFAAERLRGTSRAAAHVTEMAVTSALIPPLAIFWRLVGALRFRVRFF